MSDREVIRVGDRLGERSPWWGWVGCGGLILALLASWVMQASQYKAVAGSDWAAAAQHLRDNFELGDVVRIEPFWSDDARVFLPGLPVDTLKHPEIDTLAKYKRVWVIAGYGKGEQSRGVYEGVVGGEAEVKTIGDVDLLLYKISKNKRITFDAVAELTRAKVRRVYGGGREEQCDRWEGGESGGVGGAWHCGGRVDPYLYTAVRYKEMEGEARTCVFAAPAPEGGWLEVRYGGVKLGGVLRGRVGISDESTRSERGGVVEVEVVVGGEVRHVQHIPPQDPTYYRFSFDTQPLIASLQKAETDITFRVRAADLLDRFPCFEAVILADGL